MQRICLIAFVLGAGFGASPAATLSVVPMQGGMVMPMLAYRASDGVLSVMLDPTVPELVPLLVSHPGDTFDPADPWYDALDPSRQGLAFSRRYGFVMSTSTDPLPESTGIWLRMVSATPGLGVYRYRSSSPKLWEPIFGTSGTTNAMYWDGTMFHPAFTALPGSGSQTATFEAFLMDTRTGLAVPGGSTGPFTFQWTVAEDGRPKLGITRKLVVDWPAETTGYALETAPTLTSVEWTIVTNQPVEIDGRKVVLLEPATEAQYFRMRQVP